MAAHDLTWEEADRWIRELGTDWGKVLKAADVGTHKDMVKLRWRVGGKSRGGDAPKIQVKVRDELEKLERKKATPFGSAILALEEWVDLGAKIAQMPEDFLVVTQHLRRLAEAAQKAGTAQSTVEAARAMMAEAMSPFREPLPAEPRETPRSPVIGARKPSVTRKSGSL